MKRVHAMPFGAELRAEGVRFSLWAPSAKKAAVVIDADDARDMSLDRSGWAELYAPGPRAGARYSFRIDDRLVIPDPASRFQPAGPLASSMVVDPKAFEWSDSDWRGRPWEEAVIWEAHVGAATAAGTYAGLMQKLPQIADLGITAVELMPLADCPGERNWGYDGVLPFAPNHAYGTPEDLKRLVDEAHRLRLMMILDVVYNHFGPSGNFLHSYAGAFFNESNPTPWGAAINFDGEGSRRVRDFFVHNALYWLDEYRFDGLRFDAVHAFIDRSEPPFLVELAERIREGCAGREIHLVLENEKNEVRWLERRDRRPKYYTAQWNDDLHHCWHRLLTGETEGYYEDFDQPTLRLERALVEGFVYQGDPSKHQNGKRRGEKSSHLPPTSFVCFLQNHDQVGNRAFGERLSQLADSSRLAVAHAALLLCPQIPMLFMGEEWSASSPFLFFVDFSDDPKLSQAVRDGRRQEFARFTAFSDPERIPDPIVEATLTRSKLDWSERMCEPHRSKLKSMMELIALRRTYVEPLLKSGFVSAASERIAEGALEAVWRFRGGELAFAINFADPQATIPLAAGRLPFWRSANALVEPDRAQLPAWNALFMTRV